MYAFFMWVRNVFYDIGLFRSSSFAVPTIVIGNLSVGGTGKTPHTEYVVEYLKKNYPVAVLSRGYGRQSKGFQEAGKIPLAALVGDEPAQIKHKFPDVCVVVDANRVRGMKTLLARKNPPEVVVLDDAFQHRKLAASFYILLTPFQNLYSRDVVLPAGNLREGKAGAKRAQIIIVTKCPDQLSVAAQKSIIEELAPTPQQEVYFTRIGYGLPVGPLTKLDSEPFLLVTGIADAAPLVAYLQSKQAVFTHKGFSDHHQFTTPEIESILGTAKQLGVSQILTTEKDFQRLPIDVFLHSGIGLSYLPIKVEFLNHEARFLHAISTVVAANR
jgi:tetraacyldisaccharide 4'-kinase